MDPVFVAKADEGGYIVERHAFEDPTEWHSSELLMALMFTGTGFAVMDDTDRPGEKRATKAIWWIESTVEEHRQARLIYTLPRHA